MRNFLNQSILIVGAILLVRCQPTSREVLVKQNKMGGLYEMGEIGKRFISSTGNQSFVLDTTSFISFNEFIDVLAEKTDDGVSYSLNSRLSEKGTEKLKLMTERNIGKQVCFVIQDKVIFAPIVQTAITNGMVSMSVSDSMELESIIKYLEK